MGILWTDSFVPYSATADLATFGKWLTPGATWSLSASGGRFSNPAMVGSSGSTTNLTMPTGAVSIANTNTIYIGFWVKMSTTPASLLTLFSAMTSVPATNASWKINTSGQIGYYSSAGVVLATGTVNLCDNVFHFVEIKYTAIAAGAAACQIDGGPSFEWNTTFSPGSGTIDHFQFASIAGITTTISDFYIATSAAPAYTFPQGPRRIVAAYPSTDSAVQFTRSTGASNASCVDEVVPSSSDFVSSGTSGNQDLYTYTSIGYTPSTITGVVVNSIVENPGGGTINFQNACKSNATTTLGTSTVTPLTKAYIQTPYNTDPNTSAAWGASGLTSATFGIKVV